MKIDHWVMTTQNENRSGSPRSLFATLCAQLVLVKQAYLAVMRYMDADNAHRPDFLFRRSATRDLVREAMSAHGPVP
jgi:hypothetical protein